MSCIAFTVKPILSPTETGAHDGISNALLSPNKSENHYKKKLFENYCIKFKTLFVSEINVPGINNKSVGSTFCAS